MLRGDSEVRERGHGSIVASRGGRDPRLPSRPIEPRPRHRGLAPASEPGGGRLLRWKLAGLHDHDCGRGLPWALRRATPQRRARALPRATSSLAREAHRPRRLRSDGALATHRGGWRWQRALPGNLSSDRPSVASATRCPSQSSSTRPSSPRSSKGLDGVCDAFPVVGAP